MKSISLKTGMNIGKWIITTLLVVFVIDNIIDFIQALSYSTIVILCGLWICRGFITGIIKVVWFLFKIYVFVKMILLFIIG